MNNKMKSRPCLCCWGQWSWIYLQQLRNYTKRIYFPSLPKKSEPFIFSCMKRHHVMIILVDHFPSALGCPFSFLIFYCSLNLLKFFSKMLYLLVSCFWQNAEKNIKTFYLTKKFSGLSWRIVGNRFQDHNNGMNV